MRKGLVCGLLAVLMITSIGFVTSASSPDIATSMPQLERTPGMPSQTFSPKAVWDNLFSSISESNLQNIVRTLSENHAERVWFTINKVPSVELEGAWDYVNETLSAYTSGNLHFKLMTEQLSLIAVKNGSNPNLAPIIIAGIVSSRWAPGANYYGASVAAVIESARVLNPLNLTNDVYFVLCNPMMSGGSFYNPNAGNDGMKAVLDVLEAQNRRPAGVLWFSQLLFNSGEDYGDRVLVDSGYPVSGYDQADFLIALAGMASELSGEDRFYLDPSTSTRWIRSGAFEAWERGIPGLTFGQFYGDSWSGGEYDTWDVWAWDYNQAKEAVGIVTSITAYLGMLGHGAAPQFSWGISLNVNATTEAFVPLTGNSFVNVTLSWSQNTTIRAEIRDPHGVTVYSRIEDDHSMMLGYLVESPGVHSLFLENTGNESTPVTGSYSHWQDFDQDSLDDWEEYIFGTDSLLADSDMDLLEDADELAAGTDPRNPDSDSDGAWDGIEVMLGSDPLIVDSDGDTLLDGLEISLGMNPTTNDSDSDGVTDDYEIEHGMNPLSNDSDSDGLLDMFEVTLGTNATSSDSDGDGLTDLFEVLNGLNPLSTDTDLDGLDDYYEVMNGLLPFDIDSDADGIPDGSDWAPTEHWMSSIPVFGLGAFTVAIVAWLFIKRRAYNRSEPE